MSKGDEMGYFAFGGSSIILLFEPECVVSRADITKHSSQGYETAVKMGEYIGQRGSE